MIYQPAHSIWYGGAWHPHHIVPWCPCYLELKTCVIHWKVLDSPKSLSSDDFWWPSPLYAFERSTFRGLGLVDRMIFFTPFRANFETRRKVAYYLYLGFGSRIADHGSQLTIRLWSILWWVTQLLFDSSALNNWIYRSSGEGLLGLLVLSRIVWKLPHFAQYLLTF